MNWSTRRRGFTLLEVLVALAILSSLLVLAYRVVAGAVAAEDRSERWTTAALLGEQLLRDSIAAGFPEVQETDGKFDPPNDAYTWKRSVKQAVHPDARQIDVTVAWKGDGGEESFTLSGLSIK